ncbi:MAG: hypothetical protein LBR72_01915 [Oscillospiraceae bacterium]|jgi:hypothetical protein|nr:hypothetical protein [Oscillospiraceae bacterium]
MNDMRYTATVNEDGSLTITAFAARGLGYEPGDEVNLALPTDVCAAVCGDSELRITRNCGHCAGADYIAEGDRINIPANLLLEAGLSPGCDSRYCPRRGC